MPLHRPLAGLLLIGAVAVGQQPMPPEQQAEALVTAGQKAFAAGDFNTANQRFTETIQKFGNTRQALAARYGLGLVGLSTAEPDYAKCVEHFTPPANDGGFPERGAALYQLAVCQRQLGLKELARPQNNPQEAQQVKQAADQKFNATQQAFRTAMDWFAGQKQDDWAARSRCDVAEMDIRLGKVKEARGTCEPFTKDPNFTKSKYKPLGLYYHGLACFLDRDIPNAGRSLNQLAPFADPAFGIHARYLIGRVHHLSDEKPEASVAYEAVLAEFEKAKLAAAEQLKQPDRFKTQPFEFARLRALAGGPVPEYVAGAAFHGASIQYETGKFPEALAKFQAFAKTFEKDPLAPDAQLRVGFCFVQLKQYDEAAKTLQPLVEKTPRLADQAQFWLGKAQFGLALAADPNNPADRENKTKAALDTLRKAIEKAQQLAQQNDPDAKARRPEMLLDLADALQTVKHFKDAVQVCEQLWNENALPNRKEELLQRLVSAAGAAGDYQKSDDRANEFRRTFPQSTLTPAVAFRVAENAFGRSLQAVAEKKPSNEVKQRLDDAIAKYEEVVKKFPEYDRAAHAKLGVGVCQAQLGNLDAAVKVLESIPAPDRAGELAMAAYLLADCYIRLAPTKAEDALQENQIREKLTAAAGMLDGFIAGNPKAAEAPAALLKLGLCLKRLGAGLADQNERNQTLQKAREANEKLAKDYPKDLLSGQARLEAQKVRALQGDRGGAMNDLRAFVTQDATKNDRVAPLALLHLATMHREQNQPADAAKVLDEHRKRLEPDLAKDPERADWNALLKYHHGLAIQEMQKFADARKLFEEVVQQNNGKPVGAEAALRTGQCKIVEARKLIQDGVNARNQAGNDQNKKNLADQAVGNGRNMMFQAAEELVNRADQFRNAMPTGEGRARMLYDAAWAYRELAIDEVNATREAMKRDAHAKLIEDAKKTLPPNSPQPNIPVPEIDRAKVPVQRGEERAFNAYRKLFEEFPDAAIGVDARLEVAEMRAERNEHAEIVKVLKEALDKEPTDRPVPPDTVERIRLRLGASLYATKDFAAAASQFEGVAGNAKSPYFAQALYRCGESLFAQGEYAKAIEKLSPFRDRGELHNIGGLSDRAMLRLGFALIADKKPDAGRATLETMLQRFGAGNPFAAEARFGFAQALFAEGKIDDAVKAFEAVIAATQSELAAKAQMGVGQCRMAQKKYGDAASAFLLVPYTYDYPELAHAAVLEAARAFEEDKKPEQAEKLLAKLMKDTPPDSEWHKAAKERLGKLKK